MTETKSTQPKRRTFSYAIEIVVDVDETDAPAGTADPLAWLEGLDPDARWQRARAKVLLEGLESHRFHTHATEAYDPHPDDRKRP